MINKAPANPVGAFHILQKLFVNKLQLIFNRELN